MFRLDRLRTFDPTAVDLSKLDLSKLHLPKFDLPKMDLPKFDLSKMDLPKFDLPKMDLPKAELGRIGAAVRDGAYVGLGAAVVAAKTLDERGRAIGERLAERVRHLPGAR